MLPQQYSIRNINRFIPGLLNCRGDPQLERYQKYKEHLLFRAEKDEEGRAVLLILQQDLTFTGRQSG